MSDFDDEAIGVWLDEKEAARFDAEMGKINRALMDKEESDLYEKEPGENDAVQMLKMSRVVANPHHCEDCRHFHADETTCDAYPDGVPTRILYGEFDHIIAYEGDHGLRWRPKQ